MPLDFSGANLHVLGLMNTDLRNADLRGASARGANLVGVNLQNACLDGADLEGAVLSDADLRGCSFKNCTGFPSGVGNAIVDVKTYERSGWGPETLVKWHHAGCKILALDEFTDDAISSIIAGFARSLVPEVFISYGGCDSDVAMMIATHLEGRGIRVFFAGWDIDYGADIVKTIEDALDKAKAFLIILSPEALKRPWVQKELSSAFYKALNDIGRLILPVMYKETPLPSFLESMKYLPLKVPYIEGFEEIVRRIRAKSPKTVSLVIFLRPLARIHFDDLSPVE